MACQKGQSNIVNYLLSRGAKVDILNYQNQSELFVACLYICNNNNNNSDNNENENELELVRLLLLANSDVNIVDNQVIIINYLLLLLTIYYY